MRAAGRAENSWSVYASFCFFGMLVNAPLAIRSWKTPIGKEWIALGATALFAMGAQLLLTFSLRWVDAMTVGVISHLAIPISMALGNFSSRKDHYRHSNRHGAHHCRSHRRDLRDLTWQARDSSRRSCARKLAI